MTDDNQVIGDPQNQADRPIHLSDLHDDDQGHNDDPQVVPPAVHDSGAASGHAPDLEVDDDVDELGEEVGINYDETEELGIDHKVPLSTETIPPEEDRPS